MIRAKNPNLKRRFKYGRMAFLLVSLIAISACSARLLVPTQSDVDRVANKYPNYTLAELNEGKTQFVNHCGTCHALKNPSSRTEEEWNKIVPEMVQKANKKNEVIDAKSKESILKYLVTMRTKNHKN